MLVYRASIAGLTSTFSFFEGSLVLVSLPTSGIAFFFVFSGLLVTEGAVGVGAVDMTVRVPIVLVLYTHLLLTLVFYLF